MVNEVRWAQLSSTISKLSVEQVADTDTGSTLYGLLPTTISEYSATMEVEVELELEMKTRRSIATTVRVRATGTTKARDAWGAGQISGRR